jgi:Cu(I)/Ag(I) efflux system membrane fusion protein
MIKLTKKQRIVIYIVAALLILIIGYELGRQRSRGQIGNDPHAGHDHEVGEEAKETVWTCSMHPQVRLPKKGLCPICNMDLIPLTDDGGDMEGLRRLSVSENAASLMDIAVAPVEHKFVTAFVRMVGKIDYDETKLSTITAWIPGRLDRLFVDYTGIPVRKGDHLVSLYSPELLSAQEELLQAIKAVENIKNSNLDIMRRTTEATLKASREKLGLWGLTAEQIAELEERGTPSDHITIYAPSGGIVIHKNAMEGMYVKEGTPIYTIADLSQVWVKLDAYESDLEWLRYGQTVEFTTVAYAGQVFTGTVAFIDPVLNAKTRTVKVRVNVPNPDGRLKPDMFIKAVVKAQVAGGGRIMDAALIGKWICPMHPNEIHDTPGDCAICEMPLATAESLGYVSDDPTDAQKPLVIPVSAALVTGTRAIVYVQVPDTEKPTYEGREIVLGPRAGDYYLVRSGLTEGERVVVKGNFKLDAELQIMAKPSMMTPGGGGGGGGHDHGGPGPAGPEASDHVEEKLDALVRHQINQVMTAAQALGDASGAEDLAALRSAFTQVRQAVDQVDMTLLTGHAHMVWMEYAMRIRNDAAEGAQGETLPDAQRVAGLLAQNATALQAQLGLSHAGHGPARPVLDDTLKQQLSVVFASYYAMQKALAGDDPAQTTRAADQMKKGLAQVDMSLFDHQTHMLWMESSKSLDTLLVQVPSDQELAELREHFYQISLVMIKLTKALGPIGVPNVYQMHCPMAFDNRGASWLQDNDDLVNPYFGDMMLKCGSVEDVISSK